MDTSLTLRTLALLAFVAASTTVILMPQLTGGAAAAHLQAIDSVVGISHG